MCHTYLSTTHAVASGKHLCKGRSLTKAATYAQLGVSKARSIDLRACEQTWKLRSGTVLLSLLLKPFSRSLHPPLPLFTQVQSHITRWTATISNTPNQNPHSLPSTSVLARSQSPRSSAPPLQSLCCSAVAICLCKPHAANCVAGFDYTLLVAL